MNVKALYKLGYGVYVVTSKKGDRINGQIANTVFQVTSEPPTVAVISPIPLLRGRVTVDLAPAFDLGAIPVGQEPEED